MSTCRSCGGVIGRDCFNPVECEWIGHQQEAEAHRENGWHDGYQAGHAEGYARATADVVAFLERTQVLGDHADLILIIRRGEHVPRGEEK